MSLRPDKAKDVHGQRAVLRPNLVDGEIIVRKVIRGDTPILGGLPIVWLCTRINNLLGSFICGMYLE